MKLFFGGPTYSTPKRSLCTIFCGSTVLFLCARLLVLHKVPLILSPAIPAFIAAFVLASFPYSRSS